MWANRMQKEKKAKTHDLGLAIGELAVFMLAWVLGIVAALSGDHTHLGPGNDIAATGNHSNMTDVLD